MSYQNLSLNGFINEISEVSDGPHPRRFCFVLGAGASMTSGIKSGGELVEIWDKELMERNEEEHLAWKGRWKITDKNKYSFYSQYYERRFERQPMDGYNYLERLMESAKPSVGYVMLAHLLIHTKHNVVITTNFDHLAEDAVNYYTQTIPLTIGHESLAHYISNQINRPMIVKIHRDLLFDPKNRADELETLHKNWKDALGIIFEEYHPIFIGYAGNDKSLMNFLLENTEKFRKNEWKFPYWLLYHTDELNEMIRQFLDETDGYLVRHSGFDRVMYLLGAKFEYKVPAKEDFLSDAEERYRNLMNAIDAFTEKSTDRKRNMPDAAEQIEETAGMDEAIHQITSQTELQHLYRKAVELNNNEQYEEALKIERKLIEQEPDNARYHHQLGMTLYEMGCYEESVEADKKAVELDPADAYYHVCLGEALDKTGFKTDALNELRMAVKLDPVDAYYHCSLGKILYESGYLEEALEENEMAVELEPEDAFYHSRLGYVLREMKRYEEASSEMQKAVKLAPEKALYHSILGDILECMGNNDQALVERRKAVELEPEDIYFQNKLKSLTA